MALARVVTFDGVSEDRIEEMKRDMNSGGQPEGLDATEIIVLHDPEARERSRCRRGRSRRLPRWSSCLLSVNPRGRADRCVTRVAAGHRMTPTSHTAAANASGAS
jgi:hypothetical protein